MTLADAAEVVATLIRENKALVPPIAFMLALGESIAVVSLFLPATTILLAVSGLLATGDVDFLPVWFAAGLGGSLGYALSYWLGLTFKSSITGVWPFRTRPGLIPRGHALIDRHGVLGVFLGHFFGPARAVVPVVAGMLAMRQIPFQIANITSSFIWAGAVLAPGHLAGWLLRGG